MSEPAISVKRKKRSGQIWALEKLENKIIDMREMYEERKLAGLPMRVDNSSELEADDSVCVVVHVAWLFYLPLVLIFWLDSEYPWILQA